VLRKKQILTGKNGEEKKHEKEFQANTRRHESRKQGLNILAEPTEHKSNHLYLYGAERSKFRYPVGKS
jgi:hypothetical protein